MILAWYIEFGIWGSLPTLSNPARDLDDYWIIWWQILLKLLVAGRKLIIHTHLSSREPPLPLQAWQRKSVIFSVVLMFPWYSSESRIILRRAIAIRLVLTLDIFSPPRVFGHSRESNCSTMQLVKPRMPKKLKTVEDLALSSKSGSTPGATNPSALSFQRWKRLTKAYNILANFSTFFEQVQGFSFLLSIQNPHSNL